MQILMIISTDKDVDNTYYLLKQCFKL